MGNRYFEVLKRASSFLEEREIDPYTILFVFLERKGWSKTDWLIHMKDEMPDLEQTQVLQDVQQLIKHYPPQYLVGQSEFFGHRFFVTPDTLIPRPETEELIACCLEENLEENLEIVDVGTGSGAIAISLKLAKPGWSVTAIDLSKEALSIAQKNAKALSADISFIQGNGLQPIKDKKIDLLISNPPYISELEWELMDESVRSFEPKLALFAKENGLALYQQLATEAKKCLKKDGKIYLEIGFKQGEAVRQIFQQNFIKHDVRVKKDLSGNDRIVIISPKEKE